MATSTATTANSSTEEPNSKAGHGDSATSTKQPSDDSQETKDNDFSEFRHLLACDNDACGKMNPRKRCGRCQATYYCSISCQKMHWNQPGGGHKSVCRSLAACRAEWKAKWEDEYALPDITGVKDDDSALMKATSGCGICLETTIHHPVVLSKCQHVFCFKCLSDYQGYRLFASTGLLPTKECPYCRAAIERHVVDEALEKGTRLFSRGRFYFDDDKSEECNEMYRLAQIEVDKVLEADPRDTEALCLQAALLQTVDPLRAVDILNEVLELDRLSSIHYVKANSMIAQVRAFEATGNAAAAEQMAASLERYSKQYDHWPRRLAGVDPQRLWSTYHSKGRVYEVAGHYTDAMLEYRKVCDAADRMIGQSIDKAYYFTFRECCFGVSRCLYQLGDFEAAICKVEYFVAEQRCYAGLHKLIALPLLALAEEVEKSGSTTTAQQPLTTTETTQPWSKTLDAVIEVMYKGFVYECQWNDVNKKANGAFLQELCERAAMGKAPRDETKAPQAAPALGVDPLKPATRKNKGLKKKKRGGK